jgi:hypothetical protein
MEDDIQTHDIGLRAIRARYYRDAAAWECLIEAFKSRPAEQLTLNLPIALAKLLGHDDIGYILRSWRASTSAIGSRWPLAPAWVVKLIA